MFGFVVANPERLTQAQRDHYREVYCGLCRALGKEHGFVERLTLTYDLAFLILLLSAVAGEPYTVITDHCPAHLTKRRCAVNRFTSYAAQMNIALAYYKFLDDKKDEKSPAAAVKAAVLRREALEAAKKYPTQCRAVTDSLNRLSEAESSDILMPDIPAGIFGELMGALLAAEDTENRQRLYDFGYALGKAIYIMDAAVDRKKDIKRGQYNPLVMLRREEIKTSLDMLMAEAVEKYRQLTVRQDAEIIENILYSGIWTVYESRNRRRGEERVSEQ